MKNNKENLITRPPVVVVLGHIDSGKTTLLDNIRESHTAEKETGGITQHIGAYQLERKGKKITFIDTPGHEAFSQMRSRGAKAADIAILVIDSAKGVEAQTKEVIRHIKEADIPCIVALNKMDRPEADPRRAENELQKEGISVESVGGKTPSVKISAKTGEGVEDLLDLIGLVAEMQELKTDAGKPASGVVIESYIDSKRGPTATLILSEGKLQVGSIIATPSTAGKIKILENFQGKPIKEVLPGDPAVCLGLGSVPSVGEKFRTFPDLEEAESFIEEGQTRGKEKKVVETGQETGQKTLNVILKTDVAGSVEAVEQILQSLPQEKVAIRILKAEVGDINENDVKLAQNSRALILGFRVKTNPIAQKLLQREEVRVQIRDFEIIYDLVEEVRKVMKSILEPEDVRTDLGTLKVLKTFWSKKNRQIVGGRITEGEVTKGTLIEVTREEEVIDRGKMVDLQKNKKSIEKASRGDEIGILYEGGKRIEKGDVLKIYKRERKKGEL